MHGLKGPRGWILRAFLPCCWALTVGSVLPISTLDTTLNKTAVEQNNNWHSDSITPNMETSHSSTELYLKQILRQLVFINKKLDRSMIRMIGSTVKDDNNDGKVKKAHTTVTEPDCESLINSDLPSGVYHLERRSTEAYQKVKWIWNIYEIYCDQTAGGGWTVIQRRGGPSPGQINFNRTWEEYARGFGDLNGEFWLGNEWIHRLTAFFGPYELRVELEAWDGQTSWAQYSEFEVRSKEDNYQLNINGYTGNATDSLKTQNSSPFSTYDRQNDLKHPNVHSNTTIKSGWWYNSDSFDNNLNGDYFDKDPYSNPPGGIFWNSRIHKPDHTLPNNILKNAKMMIRLKNHPALNTTKTPRMD